MFDIRMQLNNKGVISADGLTQREAAQYIAKHVDEATVFGIREMIADAKENGIVNLTTAEGNDIGLEYYVKAPAVKTHFISTNFASHTRCGRPSRKVETTTRFSYVTCAICSGRTSH